MTVVVEDFLMGETLVTVVVFLVIVDCVVAAPGTRFVIVVDVVFLIGGTLEFSRVETGRLVY